MALFTPYEHGVPLLSFSGGLDSTGLLLQYLHSYEKVDVLFVKMTAQPAKYARESKAVDKILKMMNTRHRNKPGIFGEIRHVFRHETMGAMDRGATNKLPQLQDWMNRALSCVQEDTREVVVGVVNGDHQVHQIELAKHSWQLMQKTSQVTGFKGNTTDLVFPWSYYNKDVIGWMGTEQFARATSWCESMEPGNDCGVCASCMRVMYDFSFKRAVGHPEYARHPLRPRLEQMFTKHIKKLKEVQSLVEPKD